MSTPSVPSAATSRAVEPFGCRLARRVLTRAVRGRAERGTEWGEALLGEFEVTSGTWEAIRWTASGLRVAWRERRGRGAAARGAALPGPAPLRRLRLALVLVLIPVLTVVAVRWLVATVVYIPSGSMQPTLQISDRVLVDKLSYHLHGPRYGDVVLFTVRRPQAGRGEAPVTMVKRVVGLPGDTIACRGGQVYRNGAPLDEDFLPAGTSTDCERVRVPSGRIYVLGDLRNVSVDSRQYGPVAESNVIGRVVARIWPLSRFGTPGA